MSFLDVVSCGFGAIVLLLVIFKHAEPRVVEQVRADLSGVVADLDARLAQSRARAQALEPELAGAQRELASARSTLAQLSAALARARGIHDATQRDLEAHTVIEGRLADARQDLTEEMKRLLGQRFRRAASDKVIGGIPVDSEYVVFIIDTSGSMREFAWPLVLDKVGETLAIYPKLRGIQVMNDMGQYMFSSYAGRWIPDSPARRKAIVQRLRSWTPFSNSSPVEGIAEAIRRFYSADRKISLYVFGDEYSGGSLEAVVQTIQRLNRADRSGARRVRIHGVGFPTQFLARGVSDATGVRFASLMRVLAQDNGGTFVGLNSVRR